MNCGNLCLYLSLAIGDGFWLVDRTLCVGFSKDLPAEYARTCMYRHLRTRFLALQCKCMICKYKVGSSVHKRSEAGSEHSLWTPGPALALISVTRGKSCLTHFVSQRNALQNGGDNTVNVMECCMELKREAENISDAYGNVVPVLTSEVSRRPEWEGEMQMFVLNQFISKRMLTWVRPQIETSW